MNNLIDDLMVLRRLGVAGMPQKAPHILLIYWLFPNAGWIKINNDGASLGTPGIAGVDGIFCTSRGIIKVAFAIFLSRKYAFEAKLLAVIYTCIN